MSAFVVDKVHIDAMVWAALAATSYGRPFSWYWNDARNEVTTENADEVGQMLIDQCVKSVSHRYSGAKLTDLPGPCDAYWVVPYHYKPPVIKPELVESLKNIRHYEYQACEDEDWEATTAYAFCLSLTESLIMKLQGYEAAPWGWEMKEIELRAKAQGKVKV
jgi:hypothetical protein